MVELAEEQSIHVRGLSSSVLRRLSPLDPDAAAWRRGLAIRPAGLVGEDLPPMAGRYTIDSGRVTVRPRHPLAPGGSYVASWRPAELGVDAPSFDLPFEVPPREGPAPRLTAVFPSSRRVPENLLRFYLHFDRPMRRWGHLEHVALVDARTGEEVAGAFHPSDEGLWNRAGTRLTLWLEPGRIKRGLRNHIELGPPLVAGRTYRLVVRAGWPDASGRLTTAEHVHVFVAEAPDRKSPVVATWSLAAPMAGTREPVVARFGESLDHALVPAALSVRRTGAPLPGSWAVDSDESVWRFRPRRPWESGTYEIAVDGELEDLAGNDLDRRFEEPVATGRADEPAARRLSFLVASSATPEHPAAAAGKESS